jgi:MSHA biogenesis protein MshP
MTRSASSLLRTNRRRQCGVGLATALFVITIMALLAVLIVQLVRMNAQTTEEEILLLRAFYAAQSGVEYGLNHAFPPDGTPTACPTASAPMPMTFPLETIDVAGLDRCTFDVSCSALTVDSTSYYTIRSTGTCQDVSRTVQVRAQ